MILHKEQQMFITKPQGKNASWAISWRRVVLLLNPLHFLDIATEFLWDLEELLIWEMAAWVASFVIWIWHGVASHLGSGLVSPNLGVLVEQLTGMAVHQQLESAE